MGRRQVVIAAMICGMGGILLACTPANRAALVPQLDLGLRSLRYQLVMPSAAAKRWDVTVFARLVWTQGRPAPSPLRYPELSACLDPSCAADALDPEAYTPDVGSGQNERPEW